MCYYKYLQGVKSMRILTIGDSWTYGAESSDPKTMSWPAQLANKYNVEVVNLAQLGSSNKRQIRICFEELARDQNYDYIIYPLVPGARTELLKNGKWQQVWPADTAKTMDELDKLITEYWHPWNDVQDIILQCFYFINTVENFGIKLFVTGLSFKPLKYTTEINWIEDYKNDNNFESLGMPLTELNIGIKDLDRKLRTLKALHHYNLHSQPEYFTDVVDLYLKDPAVVRKYGGELFAKEWHPNDAGYTALADYFANKIGLTK